MATKNIGGLVLSRINFGEADRLLTVFSDTEGKIKILAKGSRKIKSKMAPHIEPFTFAKYFVAEGKSFYILAGAESTELNPKITTDLDVFKDACYIAELLNFTLVEGVPSEKLFAITHDTYMVLPDLRPEEREAVIHFFEYQLLKSNGYTPNFSACRECGKKLTEKPHYFGTFEGVTCDNCGEAGKKISLEAFKILRYFGQCDLDDVLRIKGLESYNKEIKEVLVPFLYDILPKNPKAKEI